MVESLRPRRSGSRILAVPFGSIRHVPVYPLTAKTGNPFPHAALEKLCTPLRESRDQRAAEIWNK